MNECYCEIPCSYIGKYTGYSTEYNDYQTKREKTPERLASLKSLDFFLRFSFDLI